MLRLSKKSKETVTTFAKRRPIATTMLCLGALGLSLGGLTTGIVLGTKKGDDAFTNDFVAADPVGEIWNGSSFDKANLQKLFDQISGQSNVGFGTLRSMGNATTTAADMAANNDGKEIVVTLGDLKWTPTYLSTATDGSTILTLWLTNSSQLSGKNITSSTTFNAYGQSTWSSGWYKNAPEYTYPSNMYGTSYIRAVTLNNGGKYANSDKSGEVSSEEEVNITTVEQDPASVFAKFTMDGVEGSLTDYIVEPARVQWQEYGQEAKSQFVGWPYSCPNENWSDQIPNRGAYMGMTYNFYTRNGASLNYAGKGEDNYIWREDKIWLPSITETGYSDTEIGLWNTSTTQRQNSTYSWLRSGNANFAFYAYALYSSGADQLGGDVNRSYGVRPALHLNLTSAAVSAGIEVPPLTWADITTATDFAGGTGEESAPYEIATAEQLALLAKRVNDPNTHDDYASLYYKQTADIRLGGHDWQPIGIDYEHTFTGHYNGNGYKIQGITINSADECIGLFGYVENGIIENVVLQNGSINCGDYVGSIVGFASASKVINCKSNVNIFATNDSLVGGLIGLSADEGMLVSQCQYSGEIVAPADAEGNGGLVGWIGDGAELKSSIFDGTVNGGLRIGGLAGWEESGPAYISDCISKGTIIGSDTSTIGSLCGEFWGPSISNCAAYGYIKTDNPTQTGALIGGAGGATISGCSFSGTCNIDGIAPFVANYIEYNDGVVKPTITACYVWLNNDVKVYSDDTSDWAEYYGLAGSMNDGLPMQRSLFAIASVSPATTQDILAVFSPDDGWTKFEAA